MPSLRRPGSGWHRKADTAAERQRVAQYRSPQHRAAVAAVKALVATGTAHCWRCKRYLPPGSPVHAGHDDHDRTIYRGPECPPCNLRAASVKGNRISNANRKARRIAGRPSGYRSSRYA